MLKRRNKDSNQCIEENYDEKIILKTAQKVGCKHPINKLNTYYPNCDNKDDIKDFNHELYDVDPTIKYLPPCRSIISLNERQGDESMLCKTECDPNDVRDNMTNQQENDFNKCWNKCITNSVISIQFTFDDNTFKEMVYNKVFSLESFLGNSGGYIGKLSY